MMQAIKFLLYICDLCSQFLYSIILYYLTFEKRSVMNCSMVYRAKENDNITVDWSTNMKTNWTLINMICEFVSDSVKIVFDTVGGSLVPADEQFAGRVHLDKDAPQEAKIRLHLSRVQTGDSGIYTCYLNADFDDVTEKWRLQMKEQFVLNVTTGGNDNPSGNILFVATPPYAELAPTGPDQTIRLAVTLSVAAVFVALILYILYRFARSRSFPSAVKQRSGSVGHYNMFL